MKRANASRGRMRARGECRSLAASNAYAQFIRNEMKRACAARFQLDLSREWTAKLRARPIHQTRRENAVDCRETRHPKKDDSRSKSSRRGFARDQRRRRRVIAAGFARDQR